jgi:hypothetical protein
VLVEAIRELDCIKVLNVFVEAVRLISETVRVTVEAM